MESISGFFKELKLRLSSPFFSSFAISWIIINWKIPVGLFFYKIDELKIDGYKSYFDMISKMYNQSYFFWLPSIMALGYCFLYPILKNLILIAQSFFDSKGVSLSLYASKDERISIQKYYDLRNEIKEKNIQLEQMIEDESHYRNENISFRQQIDNLQKEIDTKNIYIEQWNNSFKKNVIDGRWEITYKNSGGKIDITIFNSKLTVNSFEGVSYLRGEFFFESVHNSPSENSIRIIMSQLYENMGNGPFTYLIVNWVLKKDNLNQVFNGHQNITLESDEFTMSRIVR